MTFFHVRAADAERAQDGAQLLQVGARLGRGAQIGLRDHLHERHARAVVVDQRPAAGVGQLAGVFFEVHPLEADPARRRVADGDLEEAAFDQRHVVLRDLIALDQVRIGIVLAIELGRFGDLGVHGQAGQQRVFDRHAIHDR